MKKLQKLMRILLSLTFLFSIGCSMGGCAEKPVPDETMMIYPDRISGKLSNNKGMGTQLLEHCLYGHSSNGALGNFPEIAGVSILSTWSVLEPREGEYYFDELDQTVQYWKSQEKSINLRICTDSSMLGYSYEGCPRWMIDKYDIPYVELDYYDGGVVPKFITVDTTNAEYRKHLSAFLDHINEHYQFEEAIEVIEIRAFGCWGEWHTGYEYKDVDERLDAMQYLIDTYCEKFMQNGKLLVLSSSWDHQVEDLYGTGESRYADYLKYSCFDYAFLKPGLGFRRDGAGSLLVYYDLEQRLMQESYRSGKLNAPNGAEFAATYQILQDPEYPFSLMDAINHDIFILRANYSLLLSGVAESLIPAIEEGNTDFIDRANEMLGYRFCVNFIRYPKSVGIGRSFDCKIQIANIAGGRFPYDGYDLKVYLLDGNGNVIASQVDESFTPHNLIMGDIVNLYPRIKIPTSVKEGKYQLAYA